MYISKRLNVLFVWVVSYSWDLIFISFFGVNLYVWNYKFDFGVGFWVILN